MVKKKGLALLLTILVLISAFTVLTGCLREEERPQEVELDILNAEAREWDVDDNTAEEDREFLWIEVNMTNLRDEPLDLTHTLFEVLSRDEIVYPAHQSSDMVLELDSGQTDTFWLVFDLPEDFEAEELIFIPHDSNRPVGWERIPSY